MESTALLDGAFAGFLAISAQDYAAFFIPFILAIFVDLMTHKAGQKITIANASFWFVIWVMCAAVFGGYIYYTRGMEAASLYTSGYFLEKGLALDNMFAFQLIFASFGLMATDKQHYLHRILYWGILGAIIFRVFFLSLGSFFVNVSPIILILFGAIVLWTVVQMLKGDDDDDDVDYTEHWSVKWASKIFRVEPSIASGKFFVGFWTVTPLFLCLIAIEVCDVVFAFDSMPVIISVVKDPYLMITSSLWAAAGLRSLFFLLLAVQDRFWAVEKAVIVLLVFVAGKLLASGLSGTINQVTSWKWFNDMVPSIQPTHFHWHVPNEWSLGFIAVCLITGFLYSWFVPNPDDEAAA